MNSTIETIINSYNPKSYEETKAIFREIIQNIVLIGLSRSGFFKKTSFYGGTALRIFYGLNRYSEDLDFTLNEIDETFSLDPYINSIIETAKSYGINIDIETKEKSINTPIESAFAKINTYQVFINFKSNNIQSNMLHKDEKLKVKFEVDCRPELGFNIETKWLDLPEFASIAVLDESSLFAGKIHAILCRTYKNNVKGRDYYDFLFYVKRKIQPNYEYLRNKLIQTGKINSSELFDNEVLVKMLIQKFNEIDYVKVKNDIARFLFKNEDLSYICKDLFIDMAKHLLN